MLLSVSRSLEPYGGECTVGFGQAAMGLPSLPLLSPARVRGQRDLAFLVGTCSVLYSVRAEIRLPEGFAGATSLLSIPVTVTISRIGIGSVAPRGRFMTLAMYFHPLARHRLCVTCCFSMRCVYIARRVCL